MSQQSAQLRKRQIDSPNDKRPNGSSSHASSHSTPRHPPHSSAPTLSRILLLLFCVAGIWVSYLTQGVVQENLSTKKYGANGERFQHLTFLNFAQSVVCFFVGFFALLVTTFLNPSSHPSPPLFSYSLPSVSNTVGPACGIISLKYISYPAQVLAKSSKMIPVMLAGVILYGVRYSFTEAFSTVLVAAGVSVFALFKGSKKALQKIAQPNAALGYSLCFLNLSLDGYTNATQDQITAKYPHTGTYHLMMGMNFWGSLYLFVPMFLLPPPSLLPSFLSPFSPLLSLLGAGTGLQAINFCAFHSDARLDLLLYCLCGAVGQNFIFLTIRSFGSLVNTTVCTTRKFMSILISAVYNGTPLTKEQWAGVAFVFSGLGVQIFQKWKRAQKKRGEKKVAAVINGSGDGADGKKRK